MALRILTILGWSREGMPSTQTSGYFGYGVHLYGVTPYGD